MVDKRLLNFYMKSSRGQRSGGIRYRRKSAYGGNLKGEEDVGYREKTKRRMC